MITAVRCGMSEILSPFRSLKKCDFIKIQILYNGKEHYCAQNICRMVINVLRNNFFLFFRNQKVSRLHSFYKLMCGLDWHVG